MEGDAGDNIQVCIRVRPPISRELQGNYRKCLTVDPVEHAIVFSAPEAKTFSFDYVADEGTTQEQVFIAVGKSICESCLQGYNGTIFAYGQTGSGKTFTMQGPSNTADVPMGGDTSARGLIPRMFEYLFALMSRETQVSGGAKSFLCKASFLEIYNEHIYDLLDPAPASAGLNLREDIKKGPFVEGLLERSIASPSEAQAMLLEGAQNRTVGATAMNRESSRSHSVFQLTIQSKEMVNGVANIRQSRLNLVDLAGSERQKLTEAAGDRLKEASLINKSLSTLGNVIMALVDIEKGRSRHIAYRDSKLTFLLKDSLGGNTRTAVVANVSPCEMSFGETLSTLKFAQRAKMIRNAAVVNEDVDGNVGALQDEIARLKATVAELRRGGAGLGGSGAVAAVALVDKHGNTLPASEQVMQLQLIIAEHLETKRRVLDDSKRLQRRLEGLARVADKQALANQELKLLLRLREDRIARLSAGSPPGAADTEEITALRTEIAALTALQSASPRLTALAVENLDLRDMVSQYEASRFGGEQADARRAAVKLHAFIQTLEHQMEQLIHEKEALSKRVVEAEARAERGSDGGAAAVAAAVSNNSALEQWRMSTAFQEQLAAVRSELAEAQAAARAKSEAAEAKATESEAALAAEKAAVAELDAALRSARLALEVHQAGGGSGGGGASEETVSRLQGEVRALQERNTALSKAVAATETRHERMSLSYNRKMSLDSDDLRAAREAADEARAELADAKDANATLSRDLAAAMAAAATAQSELEAVAGAKELLASQHAALEQDATEAASRATAAAEAADTATRELEALRDVHETQESELAFIRDQLESSQAMLQSNASALVAQGKDARAAAARLAETQAELAAARAQQVASADAATQPLLEEIAALSAKVNGLTNEAAAASASAEAATGELASTRLAAAMARDEATAMHTRVEALQRVVTEARAALAAAEAEKAAVGSRLSDAETALAVYEAKLDEAGAARVGLEAELLAVRAAAAMAATAAAGQLDETLAELTRLDTALKAARAETAAAVEVGESRCAGLEATMESVQETLMAEMTAREAAQAAEAKAQARAEAAETAAVDASVTIAALEAAVAAASGEAAKSAKALASAKASEASLEGRLAAAREAMQSGEQHTALVAEELAEAKAASAAALAQSMQATEAAAADATAAKTALAACESALAEAQDALSKAQAELAVKRGQLASFVAMQEEMEAARAKRIEEIESLKARAALADAAAAATATEVSTLTEELADATRARAVLEDALALAEEEEESRAATHQAEIAEERAARAAVEAKMTAAAAKATADRAMLMELKAQLKTTIADSAAVFEKLQDVRSFEAKTFAEACAYKEQLETVREEKTRMTADIAGYLARIEDLNIEVNRLTGHHNHKQKIQHVTLLKEELNAANDELATLRPIMKRQLREIVSLRQALGKENVSAELSDADLSALGGSLLENGAADGADDSEDSRKREELARKTAAATDQLASELAKMTALVAEREHQLRAKELEIEQLQMEGSFHRMRNDSRHLLEDDEGVSAGSAGSSAGSTREAMTSITTDEVLSMSLSRSMALGCAE